MPKKRQIPFLHGRSLADGGVAYHWRPSKALREQGWENVALGTDYANAVRQALEINQRLAAARAAGTASLPDDPNRGPRLVRWDGLIIRYKKSRDYARLALKTRQTYDGRIRTLTTWAQDGQLIVRQIDYGMVMDLKRSLENGGSSDFRITSLMAVLSALLAFAEREGVIPHGTNPARGLKIRSPKARKHFLSLEAAEMMAAQAETDGHPNLSLSILLGFWVIQRQGDNLRRFNRLAWRQLYDVDQRDAAGLAGRGGRVMGFRIEQQKTGVWIDAPIPPFLHDAIEAAWKRAPLDGDVLLEDDLQPGKPLTDWRLRRQWRDLRTRCAAAAQAAGNVRVASEIRDGQFLDLRRSGQMFMRNSGANAEWITALSGHTVLTKPSILDTYMPAHTAAACAAVACALRHRNRQMEEATG